MTCVLSPAQPFSLLGAWSAMNPAGGAASHSYPDVQHYGMATSEPESTQSSSSSAKKRASRAGTRSVSTLSAAQLDRKRANDREAQRAIRQRTKDHIESLEASINELRAAQETSEKMLTASQQRNRELESEIAYLRARLNETGDVYGSDAAMSKESSDVARSSVRSDSPPSHASRSSLPPTETAPNPRGSNLHLATQQLPTHHHQGFWQASQDDLVQVQTAPASLQDAKIAHLGRDMTNWRSHEGIQSAGPSTEASHEHLQNQPHSTYPSAVVGQYSQWTPTQVHPYAAPPLSTKPQASSSSPRREQRYPQSNTAMYPPPQGPHPSYQSSPVAPAAMPSQTGFPDVDAVVYQVPPSQPPHSYAPPTQYQMPGQVQIEPHAAAANTYESPSGPPQQAGQQYHHAQMQGQVPPYRGDASGNPYNMPSHYPSG